MDLPRRRPVQSKAAPALAATLLSLAVVAGAALAQRETNRPALEELSRRFAAELVAHRPQLYYDLLASDQEPQRSMNRNPDIQLMYIDDRGVPVFYQTTNLNAARTISTDDVWPGGGAGYSLSGLGTANADLGVWDAGGVRLTHVELVNRVIFITGDTASAQTRAFLKQAGRPVVEKPFEVADLLRVMRNVYRDSKE